MSRLTVTYSSECLKRNTTFEMVMPDSRQAGKPLQTLLLLHGFSCTALCFVPEYLAEQYQFAVVCPNGENSFWLDGLSTGHQFGTLVGEELPAYLRRTFGICNNAEDTHILGVSMGGFGALHTGLKYPQQFGMIGAMSPALIVHDVAAMQPGTENEVANYAYYRECFGEPSELLKSDNSPEVLADKLLAGGISLPEIYMCCGTEDGLLASNRAFHQFLTDRHIRHEYHESPGEHAIPFWDEYTGKIVRWMFDRR